MSLTAEQKAALYDEIEQDRPLFRQLQRALAEKHPEVAIPEVELSNEIEAARKASADEIAALKSELAAEKDARAAAEALAQAKARTGLDDEGLKGVTDFMTANGITDLDAGLKFKRLHDADAARQPQGLDQRTMQMPTHFAEAVKNRRGTRRKNLYGALADLRKAQQRADRLATA